MLAHFSLFFAPVAHFFHFLTHLKSSCIFSAIFCDFGSIFGGFGRGLGRILGGFSMFWSNFLRNAKFVKYNILHRKNHVFLYVELLENNEKATKSASKVDANFE